MQEVDPFQGLRVGSCLTFGNELLEETHVLTKQETIGKGQLGKEQAGKGTQKHCPATWLSVSSFMVMGLVYRLSLGGHSNSGSLLVVLVLLTWPRWIPAERILGGHMDFCLLSPFDLSSGCWWFVININSLMFLTRTSYHNVTHANGYCGACPGGLVSVSVSPNRLTCPIYF